MEPALSWGLRMAVGSVVPLIWGLQTGNLLAAEWITLTAESIGWVALKGTFAQRIRILSGGFVLNLAFAFIGSITGQSILFSVLGMAAVAFLAGLFKNLGERGSGLALCLYVMFVIANSHPVAGDELQHRLTYVCIGGMWMGFLGMLSALFTRSEQPYRRTIALIWKAAASLMNVIAQGWDGKGIRQTQRQIYLAEKAVREAIDVSFAFHERAAHQVSEKDSQAEFNLSQVRKASALVAAHMASMAGELESQQMKRLDESLRLRLSGVMRSLQAAASQMSTLVLTRRPDEELRMRAALRELEQKLELLNTYNEPAPLELARATTRVSQLGARCMKLMNRSMDLLAGVSEQVMIRAYPLLQVADILHPKYWWRTIRILFSPDSHTARYAARTALAAAFAMAIYKWYNVDHGYWLPFTVLIVQQPYFVATFRKAIDRTIGTLLGGMAGSLLLLLPAGLHLKEGMLFASAIGMVYFLRTRYRVSSFFITLNLVLLFSVSRELSKDLIYQRAGMTLAGAALAVISGFLLLPAWDRKWLPRYLAKALDRNWCYFQNSFSGPQLGRPGWTRYKRQAEVSNSNAFDSFSRAMQEPGGARRQNAKYYELIMLNLQITRELNNIHLEEEEGRGGKISGVPADEETKLLISACTEAFAENWSILKQLSGRSFTHEKPESLSGNLPSLNAAQKLSLRRLHELLISFQSIAKQMAGE